MRATLGDALDSHPLSPLMILEALIPLPWSCEKPLDALVLLHFENRVKADPETRYPEETCLPATPRIPEQGRYLAATDACLGASLFTLLSQKRHS